MDNLFNGLWICFSDGPEDVFSSASVHLRATLTESYRSPARQGSSAEHLEFDKMHLWRREREREIYLQDKLLVHVAFSHGGLEVRALQETQKELVHQLTETQTESNQTHLVSMCLSPKGMI